MHSLIPSLLLLATLPFSYSSQLCASYPPSNTPTPYPSKSEICTIFTQLQQNNTAGFLSHVSPTVNWTIEGTHPLAGLYPSRDLFVAALERIEKTGSEKHPFVIELVNIIGGGGDEWSAQELHVQAVCRNGLIFDNRYSWNTRWDTNKTIVEVHAYLDSALVSAAIQQNEVGTLFTYSDLRDEEVPYVTLSEELLAGASGLQVDRSEL